MRVSRVEELRGVPRESSPGSRSPSEGRRSPPVGVRSPPEGHSCL